MYEKDERLSLLFKPRDELNAIRIPSFAPSPIAGDVLFRGGGGGGVDGLRGQVEGGVGRDGLLGGLAEHGADLLVGDHQVEVGVGRAQDGDVQVPVGEQGEPVLA